MSYLSIILAFAVGYGTWHPDAAGMAALTRDEERYIERVFDQHGACDTQECRNMIALAIRDVINFRRDLRTTARSEFLFDALRWRCESMDTDVPAQRDCFSALRDLTLERAYEVAGFTRAGVTIDAYAQLRTGMNYEIVEFILGAPGEQVSYSGSGGHSAAMYQWRRGRSLIVVTFSDDELSGRSQFGL